MSSLDCVLRQQGLGLGRPNSASEGGKTLLWCFVDFARSPKFLGEGALQPHESLSIVGLLWVNTSKAPRGTPTAYLS
jgi:hypothetical protein